VSYCNTRRESSTSLEVQIDKGGSQKIETLEKFLSKEGKRKNQINSLRIT
jgi:hypothetical protein